MSVTWSFLPTSGSWNGVEGGESFGTADARATSGSSLISLAMSNTSASGGNVKVINLSRPAARYAARAPAIASSGVHEYVNGNDGRQVLSLWLAATSINPAGHASENPSRSRGSKASVSSPESTASMNSISILPRIQAVSGDFKPNRSLAESSTSSNSESDLSGSGMLFSSGVILVRVLSFRSEEH